MTTPTCGRTAVLPVELMGPTGPLQATLARDVDGVLSLHAPAPGPFAGWRPDGDLREASAQMAARGVEVRVRVGGRHVLTLGVERAPWWQRTITGARHVRYAAWPPRRRGRAPRALAPTVLPVPLAPAGPTLPGVAGAAGVSDASRLAG